MTITALRLDVETLKRDKNLLLAELGIQRDGNHVKCPFHDDKTGSMWVRQDRSGNGVWLWTCAAGCGGKGGTIIDARILKQNLRTPKEAIESLAKDLGMAIHQGPPKPKPPVIKVDEAEKFCAAARANLQDIEIFERWAVEKRGIKNLSTVERLGLGFVQNHVFYGSWCVSGWTIEVRDTKGKILCVKVHTESRRNTRNSRDTVKIPKCFYAPFGKRQPGQDKAEHGFKTIWPNPEIFGEVEDYFYHGGELKAAVMIDHGYAAGSPTAGEGGVIHPDDIRRIKAKRIWICYDDEEGKEKADGSGVRNAGLEWCEAHLKAFMLAGFDEVYPMTYGDVNKMEALTEIASHEQAAIQEIKKSSFVENEEKKVSKEILQGATERRGPRLSENPCIKESKERIQEGSSGEFEVIAAADLDAMQAAFENSELIKIPERNPNAAPGMTENYYVHPDHIRMIAVNSASHAAFMQRRMMGGYSFSKALEYRGEIWDSHTCPRLELDWSKLWYEVQGPLVAAQKEKGAINENRKGI